MLSAGASAAAFGLARQLAIIPSANAAALEDQGFYKFEIGDTEVITVYDGQWNKPHDPNFIKNASLEEVKAALEKAGKSSEHIEIPFTITIVRTGGRTIMFDAGTGAQLAPTAGRLAANIEAAGISTDEIDTVIVTHFHPDHIFGLMEKGTNAEIYPNAEIIVPEAEYAFWTDAGVMSRLPENRQGLAKRIQATFPKWSNLTRFEGEQEVTPGVVAIPAHGHTPGHTAFAIGDGNDQILVMADTTNIPALFVRNPGWHAAFDMAADEAEATRRTLFDRAIADKAIITGYHYGMPGAGRIEKDGSGYAFVPLA
ncbi:MAG: MBL fold metallo-hydrolase [Alphaproteobacteria bacterium]|nr:MBL fold metallo-hydrolase [Alphaproteobacteria bacterium]